MYIMRDSTDLLVMPTQNVVMTITKTLTATKMMKINITTMQSTPQEEAEHQ